MPCAEINKWPRNGLNNDVKSVLFLSSNKLHKFNYLSTIIYTGF